MPRVGRKLGHVRKVHPRDPGTASISHRTISWTLLYFRTSRTTPTAPSVKQSDNIWCRTQAAKSIPLHSHQSCAFWFRQASYPSHDCKSWTPIHLLHLKQTQPNLVLLHLCKSAQAFLVTQCWYDMLASLCRAGRKLMDSFGVESDWEMGTGMIYEAAVKTYIIGITSVWVFVA